MEFLLTARVKRNENRRNWKFYVATRSHVRSNVIDVAYALRSSIVDRPRLSRVELRRVERQLLNTTPHCLSIADQLLSVAEHCRTRLGLGGGRGR